MKTSQRGINLIHGFESCRLKAYRCPAGKWTIGWGHTGSDVWEGLEITQARADALFRQDLADFEEGVSRLVKVPLTQGQFDALVSFAYNCGLDEDSDIIPEGLGDSTLLKYVNQGKHTLAAAEFLKWNKSGGKVLLGLVRRRQAERELYLAEYE